MVSFDDWKKMDLRVGEILEATDHPNADRLYILKVKIDTEERQLVAGLRKAYAKEDLKGKRVIVFTNLQPATLRGVESQGMVLAAVDKETVVLLSPDKKIPSGARVE